MHIIPVLVSAVAVLLSSSLVARLPAVQRAGMRLFRDLGRIKSRKRLMAGSHNSLSLYTSVLLGKEEASDKGTFETNGIEVSME